MSVEICEFFLKNGYCTMGSKCNLYHARTEHDVHGYNKIINHSNSKSEEKEEEKKEEEPEKKQYADVTEICFSFDTTGSMSCYLDTVRESLKDIVKDLFAKVPNIRISIIAHGDYCDKENFYVIKYIDFTRDQQKLIKFVKNAGATGGGDEPECYELALWYAAHKLKWTQNAKSKALVIIGDALPHEPDYKLNEKNIDWRKETDLLRMQEVTIYGVFCGGEWSTRNKSFYKTIAKKTNGRCLELTSIKHICKLFVALCLRTSDDTALFEQYKNEILRSSAGDDELSKAIMSLSGMQKDAKSKNIKCDSAIKRLMYDLKEIKREKLIDIAVVPEEENVFKWHVNIKPIQGIFKNVYIHLTLEFPSNYPSNPPQIKLITKIPNDVHPNIESNKVCLPLFGADNYNGGKSKYGSSWSAAYSIISLLVNISSIFGEVELFRKGAKIGKHTVTKSVSNKLLGAIRKTGCAVCGHSHNTPYPVLGGNKLPFDLIEMNVNERHYKQILEQAIKDKNKEKQEQIIKRERKDRKRGVLIAGNILETVKANKFWQIKSQQGINRNFHQTVSWQFTIDMFDRKKSSTLYSDYILGFVNDEDVFFGVGLDGNVVFENNTNYNQLYQNDPEKRKVGGHSIMTYILHLNNSNVKEARDQLCIFVNYKLIATVSLPTLYIKCENFYPVMYVKDIRLHLTLNIDPKLNDVIINNKFPFEKVEAFNQLQSSYIINTKDTIEDTHKYYTDQVSWDGLLEKALSIDVLMKIFTHLSYSDLIHCKEVNVFWYSVLNGHNVLDRIEMRCFYTHESIEKRANRCILGVGLNVTRSSNKWITSVETEMDFLSLSAYKDYSIYSGAWGETITHFLPLVINEKHAKIARKAILNRIAKICDETTFDVKDALMVVTAIMNQFVVQLMSNTIGLNDVDNKYATTFHKSQQKIDPKHASEKALVGYCAFHHMLLYLVNQYPEMKEYARESIENFIDDPYSREKSETPDLGKFILNLAIVDDYKWEDVAQAFVHESLDRQVKWYLQKFPKLEYLDESKCSYKERIALTLKSTMISRRLVTFQVFFLKNICKQDGYSLTDLYNNYNKRWGRPTNEQKNMLMKAVKQLLLKDDNINSWLEYFHAMGITKYKTNLQVCNALKKAVTNSKKKEYHRPSERKNKSRNKRGKSSRYERYAPAPSVDFELEQAKLNVTDSEVIEMQGELKGHTDWITSIVVDMNNPNRIVSGSRDKSLIVWDLKSTEKKAAASYGASSVSTVEGKMVRRLKGHNHFISDVDISSDGNYVVSSSWDGLLRLWNLNTGKRVTTFVGHKKDVLSVKFSPDNRRIISCGRDKSINIWNTVGEIKHELARAHNSWITCIAYNPDPENDVFVSASVDKTVCVWEFDAASSGYVLKHRLIGHKSSISALTISPDGSLCASGDKYGNVYLWDITSGKMLSQLEAASGNLEINGIVFSPNRYWACFAVGNSVEIWDLETKGNVGILKTAESLMEAAKRKHNSVTRVCTCIAWSSDGKTLYAGYSSNIIRVWKLISPMDGLDGGAAAKAPVAFDLNAEYDPSGTLIENEEETKDDHYEATPDLIVPPIRRVKELSFEMTTSTSFMSALCIIPPKDLWNDIQDIRKLYDPAYVRWMPHINIFFPFITESYFSDIAEYIEYNIVKVNSIRSFNISLNEFSVFDRIKRKIAHSTSDQMETLFLKPNGCIGELQTIFKYLKNDWPICADKHGGYFNPHLTVGKFKQRDIKNWMNKFQSSWKGKTFKCDALYLISRRGDVPFEVRYKIPLC